MFWQREYIREGVAMTLTSTYRLDLPENGNLGSILLMLSGAEASAYGQAGGDWRIVDKISKIEIIANGATVIKSIRGSQLQALAFMDQKVPSPDTWRNYATNTQYCYFLLNFGRILMDKEKGLDLGKFDNVEIRITNTATASHFSALSVSMLGFYLRDVPVDQFSGYMRTEEWRDWTTVANETKYLDLPTEYFIRRVLMQAIPAVDSDYVEKTGMHNLMEDIELNFNTGAVKVYKGGIDELIRSNLFELQAMPIVGGSQYMNADKGVNISLGYTLFGAWGAGSQDGAAAATIPTMETGRTSFTQKPETYEADSPMGIIFAGMAYHGVAFFNFDYNEETGMWLNPEARKTVELNIQTRNHADAADGSNRIILDRYVSY